MNSLYHTGIASLPDMLSETADYIASVQLDSGAIPWFKGHLLDPWDHVEATMGLSIAGYHERAAKALEWMAKNQEPDGGFWPAYAGDEPLDMTRKESHHGAYLATGAWHHYLITNNFELLQRLWPHVEAAIEFAIGMQTPEGEIAWAMTPDDKCFPDALVTGCSSIYKSLECALGIADVLGINKSSWKESRTRLGLVLARHPERFDRTWKSKERFSMDWFYPLLCGVLHGKKADNRLKDKWALFVHPKRGCRCVSDEPWVTVAESCELVLALISAGQKAKAAQIFSQLHINRDKNGAYWTGYQTKLDIF
ncbi:MAG: phenyltransferase domain-containing protein [Desulfobacula sp.]|nr:phenyltransferase domain-containing protein [Desulfobacula sp.]